MLPLLVIPPIQPFHPRRIGLGFLSFPSSNSLISFPSCQLPPLWAHKETQAPYFQSLAASFPKNMGGIRSLFQFCSPILGSPHFPVSIFQSRLFEPRLAFFRSLLHTSLCPFSNFAFPISCFSVSLLEIG